MNPWMMAPRTKSAESDVFLAERAERRGDTAEARARYNAAADAFAAVALSVPADHPRTRSDLAIAAVATYGRAGDFGRAAEFARRVLAESGALTEPGRRELLELLDEYTALQARAPVRAQAPASRSLALRDEVRRVARAA
jgi:hypothetical protein